MVVGGASGMGRAKAELLAAGARVAILDRTGSTRVSGGEVAAQPTTAARPFHDHEMPWADGSRALCGKADPAARIEYEDNHGRPVGSPFWRGSRLN